MSCQLTTSSKKARHPHVTQVDVLKHIIHRITKSRPTIDGSRIRVGSDGRALLDVFKTLVIMLSSSKDSPQRIPQGIERDDIRSGDGRHERDVCVRREEWVLVSAHGIVFGRTTSN